MMLLTLTLASARSPESWAYHLFLGMPWLYAVIILWKNMREDAEAKLEKGLVVILGGLLALATVPLFVAAARFMEPAQGLVLAVCATGAYLSWKLAFLLPPLPRLVRAFEETEEGILAKLRIPDLARSWTEMGVIAAMVGGAIAAGFILFADAPQSLLSLAVVGGAVFIRWIMLASGKGERAVLARRALFVLLQMVSCAAILIHGEADLTSIMWAVALEVALATVALMRAGRVEFGSAVVLLSALPLVTIPAIGLGGAAIPLQAYAAMAIAPLLIVAHRLIAWTRKHWEVESLAFQTPPVVFQGWFTVVAAILSLVVLSRGAVVPESLITVSWGVVGAVLLTLGFLFLDRVMRYASFGVFGLAIARIFLHELAGAPPLTKAIAFLGVGLLLVCAALAYGFLRTRVAGKEAEHAAEDHAQQG
jgi:hypothetical protein